MGHCGCAKVWGVGGTELFIECVGFGCVGKAEEGGVWVIKDSGKGSCHAG